MTSERDDMTKCVCAMNLMTSEHRFSCSGERVRAHHDPERLAERSERVDGHQADVSGGRLWRVSGHRQAVRACDLHQPGVLRQLRESLYIFYGQ